MAVRQGPKKICQVSEDMRFAFVGESVPARELV
jgi:hypothetical protein